MYLFERRHYERIDANFDMTIDLATIPEDPGGHALAGPDDRDEVDVWMAEHWSNWRVEVLRALDKNNLVIARDDRGIRRVLWLRGQPDRLPRTGRRASRLDRQRCRERCARRRAPRAPAPRPQLDRISWVGPVVPYAALGGRVSTVYFVYRKVFS